MTKVLAKQLLAVAPLAIDAVTPRRAREEYAAFRGMRGAAFAPQPLLTPPDGNVKFEKTATATYGLAFAQHRLSDLFNVCPFSTPECRRGCVGDAGKGSMSTVRAGRIRRTQWFAQSPTAFVALVAHEIRNAVKKHGAVNVRLNTFSDLPWEDIAPDLFVIDGVTFYDYTKDWSRRCTPRYWLTYSASEHTTTDEIRERVGAGFNVAVVFNTKRGADLPTSWEGMRVVDGDATDDRTTDPRGVVVGLRAKGAMRRGTWKMVRDV